MNSEGCRKCDGRCARAIEVLVKDPPTEDMHSPWHCALVTLCAILEMIKQYNEENGRAAAAEILHKMMIFLDSEFSESPATDTKWN